MLIKISACVIVKNEERNIEKWLKNMSSIADEMIVVDTGSSDQTISLAIHAGASVYYYRWNDDFAAAKNFALEKAKGDWILFLDADEYFSEKSIHILPNYLNEIYLDKNIDAVICTIKSIDVDDNEKVIGLSQNLRVFRNDKNLRYQGKIHEKLIHKSGRLPLVQANIEFDIYHTGYSSRIIKKKLERNLKILQKDMAEKGEQPWHYVYLADCYHGLKDYEKTAEYAKKSIDSGIDMMGREDMVYHYLIEATAAISNNVKDVDTAIEISINKFPKYPEFVLDKARLLMFMGDYCSAGKYLKQAEALQIEQEKTKGIGQVRELNQLYTTMGQFFQYQGDFDQALIYYKKSLVENPYQKEVFRDFYGLLRGFSSVDIIEVLQSIYTLQKKDVEFLVGILKSCPSDQVYIYYMYQLHNK